MLFPAHEWTEIDATDEDLAALKEEPSNFIEFRVVASQAEPQSKKK